TSFFEVGSWGPPMTRQLISTNRQLLLHHVTRSVRRAAGFVQVSFEDIASDFLERRLNPERGVDSS
ncbi:MAG: hypothetical protein WBQ89_01485, partial [Candidatus Acidiferrum sp.]